MSPAILNRQNFGQGEIIAFGSYKPWTWHKLEGGDGSNYPTYSGKILDLKEGKDGAVPYFKDHILPHLGANVVIVTVPSHDPEKTGSGLAALVAALSGSNGRIDGSKYLKRTKKIDKLAHGGDRRVEVHLASIEVVNPALVRGKDVLILDDVTRTGNSMFACRKKLLEAGARSVECAAIGKAG